MDTRQRWCAAGAVAVGTVSVVVALVVLDHARDPGVDWLFVCGSVALGAGFAVTGLLLLGWRRGNRLGVVLLVGGGAVVAEFALRAYAFSAATAADPWPGAAAALWAGLLLDPLFFPAALVLVLLLFPDGRAPDRSGRGLVRGLWRLLVPLAVLCAGALVVLEALRPGPLRDESFGRRTPWQGVLPPSARHVVDGAVGLLVAVLLLELLLAAVLLVVRFRAATGVERQQYKPLLLAVSVIVLGLLLQAVPPVAPLGVVVFVVGVVVGLPLALAVGSLRYRLWDLDRAVVATLTYGGLALGVVTVYVVVVVGLVGLTGARPPDTSLVPSVLATALVAVLFAPTKDRLSARVRRLVYGRRADPYDALVALPHKLSSGPDVDEVLPLTARTLAEGLGASTARVRARLADGTLREAWSVDPGVEGDAGLVVRDVWHLGEVVGDIGVRLPRDRVLSASDERLLVDLCAQAGPAVRGVVLSAQLRDRLDEITAQAVELRLSRVRLARASADERRRLERDIHDGAQQQLVGLAVRLHDLEGAVRSGDEVAAQQVGDCRAELDACIDTVRELARGVYPPVLTARGLVAAVRARTRSFPGAASVEASAAVAGLRFHPEVELAVYFCCLEALQNAAKHAPGAPVSVSFDGSSTTLRFEVADLGPGFAGADGERVGSGLVGMRDRVAAVGGDLVVGPGPAGGTRVRGSVPL